MEPRPAGAPEAGSSLRVLLVAFAYPPFPASGSMRAEKVAHALQQHGHRVRILTAPVVRGERGIRYAEPGLSVRVLRYPRNPRHALLWLRDRIRGPRPAAATGAAPTAAKPHSGEPKAQTIRDTFRSLLFFPDEEQGFVPAVVAAALGELRAGVDLIYTTAPPFSTHLAGLALNRLFGLPWVAEFRDPWTHNPVAARFKPRTPFTLRLEAASERAVFEAADQVVVGTAGLRDELRERYGPEAAAKLVLSRNGIDRIGDEQPPPGRRPEFLHLGNLYGTRSARSLLEGFASVCGEDDGVRPTLRFVGGDGDEHRQRYGALSRSLGLGSKVAFEPWKPRAEALRLLARTDFLVLLALDQPNQVPNKLYEYLGTRKPIVALVDGEGESARLLQEAGHHILLTEDTPEAWARAFRRAFAMVDAGAGAVSRLDRLEQWTTARQFDHLVSEIERALG